MKKILTGILVFSASTVIFSCGGNAATNQTAATPATAASPALATSPSTGNAPSSAGADPAGGEVAKQKELYASLEPNRVMRATVKGKGVFYLFKDAERGIAYVGREAEYQKYHELAIRQQIAQEYYMAAEMNRQAAWGWYGAWGPSGIWW